MCWLCAHHVVDHECPPHDAATAECECLPHQIYPGRPAPVRFEHGDVTTEMIRNATPEELLRGSSLSDACREYAKETIALLTPAQRAIYGSGRLTAQKPGSRAGSSYTGSMKGLEATKLWCDEPKKRVYHCRVCGVAGHFAKTCPTVRRDR